MASCLGAAKRRRDSMSGARGARASIGVLCIAWCIAGCVGPSRTADDYAHKAHNTAKAVRSAVETVRLEARQIQLDSALASYSSVLVGDAEDDARGAEQSLASVQPPDATSDDVRTKTLAVVSDAIDAIAEVRIAVRRNDRRAVVQAARPLATISRELQGLEQ